MTEGIQLTALDGANPLAFLAALGSLRLLDLRFPERGIRLHWSRDPVWRPCLTDTGLAASGLPSTLRGAASAPSGAFGALGKNLTVDRATFENFVRSALGAASPKDRRAADFAAAFGSESLGDAKKNRIYYTDLCFISGSGHQDFLATVAGLGRKVTEEHIRAALFGPWKRDKGLSMRWDPADAAQYALQWSDPSGEGASAVWGANFLAIEALPLFPAQPTSRGLKTTGFRQPLRRDEPEFRWPLWTAPLTCGAVRSLLTLGEMHKPVPDHESLLARGVAGIYGARRARFGQGANFKVSFRPASAL
ncbi:MAG TPA: hypothetical protein VMV31_00265 [Terriglobales bacterium]|nr:hypothetical protein [Terriglobales bacterium]